jgi:NADP-reducing hydrogenase subunit HndC
MKQIRSMVLVSSDTKSMEQGALWVFLRLQEELKRLNLDEEVAISMIGDIGRHYASPLVIVYPEAVAYSPVSPSDVPYLVEEHLKNGRIATRLQNHSRELSRRVAWLSARKGTIPAEQRIVLRRVGLIDPMEIEDYIVHDGYDALGRALTEMTPDAVISEIQASGLRGRGGAGFPTGLKWKFVKETPDGGHKYVICNADESEPGTFKDRYILEGDPHSIIEAMAIAAYAVGASKGYIYVRGEYALAQERLRNAIEQAEQLGLLGDNIFGTDFCFRINVHSGAGAYICGEETALIESIEGKRGEPRARPPFPTTKGLWGKPTLVNNVETLANIPAIIKNGNRWFRKFGTASSPGTKVYTILGNVNVTGCIEVPMGITLREVVAIYGKGMKDQSALKLAQTGGSGGSVIPSSLQDTPMDFDSFSKAGVSLGSGALLICNEDTCIVDLAIVLMNFFRTESCGKCTPCRVGNQRAYEILTRISEGQGTLNDIDTLDQLSDHLFRLSNCGLGQTASTPLRDIIRHFRAELEAHIRLKTCPCGICPTSAPLELESVAFPQV